MDEKIKTPEDGGAPRGAEGPRDEDVRVRGIFLFMLGVFGLIGLAVVVAWGLSGYFHKQLKAADPPPSPMPEANAPVFPPEPRLRENPAADMNALRAREGALLEGYGWVDKEAGVARIPVDRAIELAAQGKTAAKAKGGADGGAP